MCYGKLSWPLLQIGISCMLVGLPLATQAQEQELSSPKASKTDSRYATESQASSGVTAELHTEASWDDNVLGDNARRVQDYVFEEGGLLKIWARKPAWGVGLEYRPDALLYRTASNLNRLDHRLDFDNDFHLAPHLLFRMKDSLDYTTGVLEPQSNQDVALPVSGSPGLNPTLFTPFAREFSNDASAEMEYDTSRRTTFIVSGDHGFRRFTNAGGPNASLTPGLFNTQSDVGDASYSYRVTKHFTAGFEYQFRNDRFGRPFHGKTHSGLLRVQWQVGSHLALSAFGGPEFSDSEGQFVIPSTNPLQPGNSVVTQGSKQWRPAVGGSLTLRSNQTVARLSTQWLVSDGGGLLATVSNSYEGAEIRRRLSWKWDIVFTGSNARSVALQGPVGKGAVDTQSAGMAIEHPLLENLSLHMAYNYLRQRTNQSVPFAVDLDRNRFTVGLFFRAHEYTF